MNDLLEPLLRDTFEQRAGQLDPDVRRRLMAVDYRPRRRRILVLPALGAAGLAGAVATLVLVLTLSSTPTPAFAGWTPVPTLPRPGQTARALAQCNLGRPVLVDSRGPFTAAVYAKPRLHPPAGLPSVTSSGGTPPPQPKPAIGTCFVGPNFSSSGASSSGLALVHAGQIQVTENTESSGASDAALLDGRVGRGVTGLKVRLSDGSTVTATVSRGWYLVWWPGGAHPATVQITTRGRTRAYTLPAADRVGAGDCGASAKTSCASSGPVLTVGR